MEFKNPRQVKIYLITLLTGLDIAFKTYQGSVEKREEYIKNALRNNFIIDDLKEVAEVVEKEPDARLVREHLDFADIEEFLNSLADEIFGYRFDQLSEEIGNNYEKLSEAYQKGGASLQNIKAIIENNINKWSKEDPEGLEDLWSFIENGTAEDSPFLEIIFGDSDFLEIYQEAIIELSYEIFEKHMTEEQQEEELEKIKKECEVFKKTRSIDEYFKDHPLADPKKLR
jgi:hypothetical protein